MTCIDGTIMLDFAASQRRQLHDSPFGGLLPDEKVVDLFCGAGGWGDGLAAVGIQTDFAINHDAVAIEFHQRNHPGCVHHQGDAWRTKPRAVVGRAKVGLLLASAACTTHSRARGSAPVSKRVHMLGSCILRWMKDTAPRVVIVENVAEWMDWGPLVPKLHANGKPVRDESGRPVEVHDPARKGQRWRWWLRQARRLGYALDFKVLDAADFGNASRRKRLFVMLRRDGQPIVWPEKTHGQVQRVGADDLNHGGGQPGNRRGRSGARGNAHREHDRRILPHRAAAEIIDWSNLGTSIFDRKRPLADKTLGRICEGIRRFVLNDPAPFLLRVTQTGSGWGWKVSPVDAPTPTQTTRQDLAVCSPIIAPQNTDVFGQRVDEGGPTITTKGHQALISPVLATTRNGEREGQAARVHRVSELLMTCTNGARQGLATPLLAVCAHGDGKDGTKRWGRPALPVQGPLNAIHAGGNNFGLVTLICVGAGGSNYAAKPTPVDRPCNTVKCDDRRALVTPVLMNNTSGHTGGRVESPGPTVTTGGQTGLAVPVLSHFRHGGAQNTDVRALLPTPMANGTHAALVAALFVKFYGNESGGQDPRSPLGTCTTKDRHGMVCCVLDGEPYVIVDILFRMLRPHELSAAMGFRPDYIWPTSQRDATRLIGNAVSPVQAQALVREALPNGRSPEQRRAAA